MLSVFVLLAVLSLSTATAQDEIPLVRVGMLQFGTVAWEMDVIQHHGLAEEQGIRLEVVPLSSTNALSVALQGGRVDMVVGDLIWVSRQRAVGRNFTLYPYSTAVGTLMVNPQAGIDSIKDLEGQKLGIAGGPVDKSWLLLRAYARRNLDLEVTELVDPAFAAAPLLNDLMLQGRIPAVLNYWHYGARLDAAGMEPLISVEEMLVGMGIEESAPLLGWIFNEEWANENTETVQGLLRASYNSKQILAESNQEWQRIQPLVQAEDQATLKVLRETYRAGIPQCFGEEEIAAAQKVFRILAEEGGVELVGSSNELTEGTFWRGFEIGQCPQ